MEGKKKKKKRFELLSFGTGQGHVVSSCEHINNLMFIGPCIIVIVEE